MPTDAPSATIEAIARRRVGPVVVSPWAGRGFTLGYLDDRAGC